MNAHREFWNWFIQHEAELLDFESDQERVFDKLATALQLGWDKIGNLSGQGSVNFGYDASDRTYTSSGATTQYYIYAPDGALVAVTDNTATVQKMFVHLPASRAVYVGATLTYFDHFDWQESSRVGSTWARALYSDTSYDAFGMAYWQSGTLNNQYAGLNTDIFSGTEEVSLTRRYHPSQGRWIAPDSIIPNIFNPQSFNAYAYGLNQPTNMTDPGGHSGSLLTGGGSGWLGIVSTVTSLFLKSLGSDSLAGDATSSQDSYDEEDPDAAATETGEDQKQQPQPNEQQKQSAAPANSRSDIVLYGREVPPEAQHTGYFWQTDWYAGTCSTSGCVQSPANENQTISLQESKDGGPWGSGGKPMKREANDIISPEPKKVNQHWFVADPGGSAKQVQLVVGKDSSGNFIKTWEVQVTIDKTGDRPVYSPVP